MKQSKLLQGLLHRHTLLNDSQMIETRIIHDLANNLIESPVKQNNNLYYAMRMTGTGPVVRSEDHEVPGETFRNPDDYLNPEFLMRCIGTPIIFHHPDTGLISGATKIVGTCIHSYIPPDTQEVWVVGRIIDQDIQNKLLTSKWSTSPSICTEAGSDDAEGRPLILDHIAICELGQWDREDGVPRGIKQDLMVPDSTEPTTIADSKDVYTMTPEDLKAMINDAIAEHLKPLKDQFAGLSAPAADAVPEMKADADEPKCDADEDKPKADEATPEVKADAEDPEVKADESDKEDKDKPKTDSDEDKPEPKPKADEDKPEPKLKNDSAARAHAELEMNQTEMIAALQAKVAQLEKANAPVSDEERNQISAAQNLADSVYKLFGNQAPAPLNNERALTYRRRIIGQLKNYSDDYRDVDFSKVNDSQILKVAEAKIYADAKAAARKPDATGTNTGLRKIEYAEGGRTIREFVGDTSAWLNNYHADTFRFGRSKATRV